MDKNKKAFQLMANCPPATRCMGLAAGWVWDYTVNKFEHVHLIRKARAGRWGGN